LESFQTLTWQAIQILFKRCVWEGQYPTGNADAVIEAAEDGGVGCIQVGG